ncbi:hypothetical protein BO71DRAFT_239726 [Aspergillus ellipticus CBS 707.79]|uniref:Uncharacterized protein n=1 Tax=Aspergillus ellipticus CBS 707.79 TaxID=1448320 RepID=A0A319D9S6_9EURO|nr:hypothetical protein BO71DRAFT_239726 [Aspergillus ellipticus CBS 707.79]
MAYSARDFTDTAKTLIEEIRYIIQKDPVIGESKPGSGYEFSGKELSSRTTQLEQELSNEDYIVSTASIIYSVSLNVTQASRCKVLHLDHGGNIHNRSGHLLVMPLNGSAAFERVGSSQSDEPLRPCHYLTETRRLRGENIDVIIVALEKRE